MHTQPAGGSPYWWCWWPGWGRYGRGGNHRNEGHRLESIPRSGAHYHTADGGPVKQREGRGVSEGENKGRFHISSSPAPDLDLLAIMRTQAGMHVEMPSHVHVHLACCVSASPLLLPFLSHRLPVVVRLDAV